MKTFSQIASLQNNLICFSINALGLELHREYDEFLHFTPEFSTSKSKFLDSCQRFLSICYISEKGILNCSQWMKPNERTNFEHIKIRVSL